MSSHKKVNGRTLNAVRYVLLLLTCLGVIGASGCERYALDRKMQELCEKDGGIKIYETQMLSPEQYDAVFSFVSKAKGTADYYGPDYHYVRVQDILVGQDADPERGQGRLSRWYFAIYRKSDNRLLGESVSYGRSGGDGFTFGLHPTSKVCPHQDRGLGRSVFIEQTSE